MTIQTEEGGAEMPTQMEKLAIELLGLPASSRALLARQLLASLDDEDDTATPEVSDAWLEEIKRRDAEVLAGTVQCVPAEDVMRRARERVQ
jgi:putative addiction module component (TIGR02574 family)